MEKLVRQRESAARLLRVVGAGPIYENRRVIPTAGDSYTADRRGLKPLVEYADTESRPKGGSNIVDRQDRNARRQRETESVGCVSWLAGGPGNLDVVDKAAQDDVGKERTWICSAQCVA